MFYKLNCSMEEIFFEEAVIGKEFVVATYIGEYAEEELIQLGIGDSLEFLDINSNYCKAESLQNCITGEFSIPRVLNILGKRHEISFILTNNKLILLDEDGYSDHVIHKMIANKKRLLESKEQFICNFIGEFIYQDYLILESYEQRILFMEEEIQETKLEGHLSKMMPIRKEVLTLRCYYEQLIELVKELADNENQYFEKKQLKHFRNLMDKVERLEAKSRQLLEYSQQVRDLYQSMSDAKQNRTIQYLTVISTLFFPLQLITGWYGMNFQNMPELQEGYPYVIILCIIVIIICIVFFKKKKIL